MDASLVELENCPFCGAIPILGKVSENGGDFEGSAVHCPECDARGPVVTSSWWAAKLWNRNR
jgi:Lar family restriction alleviation protein